MAAENKTYDLEPQQYGELYQEDDVPLADVRKNTLRKFVYIGMGVLLLFILLGATVQFPNQLHFPFIFKNNQTEEIYRFPESVYVLERYINSRQAVENGASLLKITSPEIIELVERFQLAKTDLKLFYENELAILKKQVEILELERLREQEQVANAMKEMKSLEQFWANDSASLTFEWNEKDRLLEANRKLHQEKVIADFELAQLETDAVKAKNAWSKARDQYVSRKLQVLNTLKESQIEVNKKLQEITKQQLEITGKTQNLEHDVQLASDKIRYQYGSFDWEDDGLVLKSSGPSTVSFVFDGDKEVPEGSILLKLLKVEDALYGYAEIPPHQMGRITLEKPVVLKVESFPHYEWGVLEGQVKYLSLAPNESGDYPFHITVEDGGDLRPLVQTGMTGTATITIEEKSLLGYLTRKVKRPYYDMVE